MNASWIRRARSLLGLSLVSLGSAAVLTPALMGQEVGSAVGIAALARRALDSNAELRAARESLVTAQEQVSEAWGNVMPSLDFNASYTRNVSPVVNFLPAAIFDPSAGPDDYIEVQFGADNQWNSTLALEQPLFRPAVIVALGAASRFQALQTEVVRGRSQSIVTRVRTGYYTLLLAQEQARLTENSVARVRASLEETRALNAAGLADDYDVLRLEVELGNLEPNLRRAENAVLQARRELAILVNLDEHETLRVRGELAEMNLATPSENSAENQEVLRFAGMDMSVASSVEASLRRVDDLRSDVRQMELTEELRRAEMRAEQATYLPEVTLFGNYIVNAQDNGAPSFFGRGDGQRATSKAIGLRVSIPVFQGFRRDARIDQRRAALRQAAAMTEQSSQAARSQVRTLIEGGEEARLRAAAQAAAVGQARRGFEIARAQYAEGLGSRLSLTDAEVALRQSEFNYAQAVYDYLVARARLDEATGLVPLVDVSGVAGEQEGERSW